MGSSGSCEGHVTFISFTSCSFPVLNVLYLMNLELNSTGSPRLKCMRESRQTIIMFSEHTCTDITVYL